MLADADGALHVDKVPTTPDDPRVGVIDGVRHVLQRRAASTPGDVSRVVHGTTLATNVILEQKGGPIAFVVTEGFADLLRLGREARVEEDRYDLFFTTPTPPVDAAAHVRGARARRRRRRSRCVALTDAAIDEVVARVAAAAPIGGRRLPPATRTPTPTTSSIVARRAASGAARARSS